MKSLPFVVAVSLLGSAAASAHGIDNADVTAVRHIATRSIETRDLPSFHAIRSEGIADIFLAQGQNQQIQVDAEEGMTSHVKTSVENGTLVIKTDDSFHTHASLKVYVTVPAIDKIALEGTGNLVGLTDIASSDLNLASSGTGSITLSVKTATLASEIAGTGNMNLSGTTTRSSVSLSGTGDFYGRKLTSDEVAVVSSGTGDAEVQAGKKLQVQLSGTGNVRYAGDVAKVESMISGTGTLRKLPQSKRG